MLKSIQFQDSLVVLSFRDFVMEYNKQEGATYTRFNDHHWTGGNVVEEDFYHSLLLGISPEMHRFQHELSHNLIGIYYYKEPYSPVLWHAAHVDSVPLPDDYKTEEWLVTALQYFSKCKRGSRERNDEAAIKLLRDRGVDVERLSQQLQTLLQVAEVL